MTKSFRFKKHVDHQIQDGNGYIVGTSRVKPSVLLWGPAESKKWKRVSLQKFIDFMDDQGTSKLK